MIASDKEKLDEIPSILSPDDTTTYELRVNVDSGTTSAEWVVAAGGEDLTGGTGITIDGNAINIDNPFTDGDETKLDSIPNIPDVDPDENNVDYSLRVLGDGTGADWVEAAADTNLSIGTRTGTTVEITSDTGSNATITAADTDNAGVLTSAQFDQLTYLPPSDDGLVSTNQYAFRPNATSGSAGGWVQVDAATNLSNTPSTENVTIESSTGLNTIVQDANGTRAGVMNTVQAGKVQYLPVADPTFNAATPTDQYALVPSSADGQAGTWTIVSHTNSFAQLTEGNLALTQLPTFTTDNANQVLQVNANANAWEFSQSSAVRFNEAVTTTPDTPDVYVRYPTLRTGQSTADFATVGVAFDFPNNAAEGDVTFFVDNATTDRPGVITSDQFDQLAYLPENATGLDANLQYVFVPDATNVENRGDWEVVDVPTLSANDPTPSDDSVSIRTRIGDTDHGTVAFTGDSRLQVSLNGSIINLNVTGEAPPSHDPYTLSVVETGTGVISGRRIDVPHETQGGVEVTIEANDGFTIHSIQDIGPVLGISVELLSNFVVRIRGDSSSNAGTYSPHFTVVYTEDTAGTRHMQREDYTLVIEEDFFAGIIANSVGIPTALSQFASGDNRGVIANGKSITVTNTLDPAETGTLFLAIPRASYNANSFEITTNGYPLAIDERTVVEDHQIIEVGTFEPTEDLTFVIQGVV